MVIRHLLAAMIGTVLLYSLCSAEPPLELQDQEDRINYSIGYQIGEKFKRQDMAPKPEALMKGIEDALSGADPLMTEVAMRAALVDLNRKEVTASDRKQEEKLKEQYLAEGRTFLAENAKNKGIVILPSGLQYKVIREGTGKSPGLNDEMTVNYSKYFIDETEFDSSSSSGPTQIRLGGIISGWTEALQLMKVGAKWRLFIPPDLAYGTRGPLAHRTLIFDVELISVNETQK
jgi:FKBP-type peptidyl-prolyl cis-trans isomerase FklB